MDEMTLLAVSVGNSETTMGLFEGDALLGQFSASANAAITADEAQQAVWSFLAMRDLPEPGASILCSVVPSLTSTWASALQSLTGRRPLVVGPGLKSGIAMGYKDPAQVGADRVAAAVAARELFGSPVIVVDFGTATSFTVVDEKGALLGGAIAPGAQVGMEALSDTAAQLAETDLVAPRQAIGRSTAEAIRSGVVLGEAARADGLVEAMWDELGYETALVATGRYAETVCSQTGHEFALRTDLVLQGLRAIFKANRK